MSAIYSFPAIADCHARILILGSIPGEASLRVGEYYAHPRNQFWPIIRELFAYAPLTTYALKMQLLLAKNIALWDVMQSCQRHGSLDSNITKASVIPNDFNTFFTAHPQITHVFFNGATAENTFRKSVLPKLTNTSLHLIRLPSTSPAHAGLTLQQKISEWQRVHLALSNEQRI